MQPITLKKICKIYRIHPMWKLLKKRLSKGKERLCCRVRRGGPGEPGMNTVTQYCSQQSRPGQSGFWSQRASRRACIGALTIVWIEPSVSSPPHGRWVPPPQWYPAECCATLREAPSSRRAAKLPLQLSVCATCSYKQWTSSLVLLLY